MNKSLIILLCVSVICAVRGTPINNNNNNNNDNSNKNLNSQDTDNSENNLIRIIDNVDSEKSLQLFGGLSIERIDDDDNTNIEGGRSATTFSSTTDKFLNRIENYLNTHELQFNWPNEENEIESGRSEVEEESRTRKLKKLLLPILIALKLKLGLILPLMMLVIKAISIKGLISGFLALLFSGATFFREMVSRKKDHITTAYITGHPLNAEIVHSTDWHRSGQASAQELAYAGYNYHTLPAGAY